MEGYIGDHASLDECGLDKFSGEGLHRFCGEFSGEGNVDFSAELGIFALFGVFDGIPELGAVFCPVGGIGWGEDEGEVYVGFVAVVVGDAGAFVGDAGAAAVGGSAGG